MLHSVIPTLVLAGPMAIVAALCPVLFAVLAVFWRRWCVFFTVASIHGTLYVAHAWLRGYAEGAWWGTSRTLLITFAIIAGVGVAISLWRGLRKTPPPPDTAPNRAELATFLGASVVGLGFAMYALIDGGLLREPWREGLPLVAAINVGTLFLFMRWPQPQTSVLATMALSNLVMAGLASTPTPPQLLWTFEAIDRGVIYSSPCVGTDHIYVSAVHTGVEPHGAVYALDPGTGKPVWTFNRAGDMKQSVSSPVLHGGRLFVGEGMHEDADCRLYCLDARTGRELWSFRTSSHVESTPCVTDGRVYFGAGDDGIYCLDAEDGTLRWRFPGVHVDSMPAVADNRLYAGSGHDKTEMLCLDAGTGKLIWRTPCDVSVFGPPVVDRERVFFGVGNGKLTRSAPHPAGALVCLSTADGGVVWRYDVADAVLGAAVVADDTVYFGARDGKCYCVNRRDGTPRWQRDLRSPIVASPILRDGRLYAVAAGGTVACLDPDHGTIHWKFDVGKQTRTNPELHSRPVWIEDGEPPKLLIGAGLRYGISSAAVVMCFKPSPP